MCDEVDRTITIGHEAFIHMDRNYPEIINASVLTKAKIKHDNTLKKQ